MEIHTLHGVTPLADEATALARRAAALQDAELRVAYVRHELGRLDPVRAADLITVIASRAEAREEPFGELLLAITVALADPAAHELRRSLASTAATRGQRDLLSLLEPRDGREADEGLLPIPDFGVGRPLTLGERKALARTHNRDLIARVVRDPHPDVISILLSNPTLTENDVVRLCARRPVPPEVLRQVFRSPRWIVRYRVQVVLIRNPYCPLDIALSLTAHLRSQDAREVAESPELAEEVRDAARRLVGEVLMH